jgi:hypothetical protein
MFSADFATAVHCALRKQRPNQLLQRTLDPVVCPRLRSAAGVKRR